MTKTQHYTWNKCYYTIFKKKCVNYPGCYIKFTSGSFVFRVHTRKKILIFKRNISLLKAVTLNSHKPNSVLVLKENGLMQNTSILS